jgi:phosphoribosyl 1,2-cyclic phosphodiesterase
MLRANRVYPARLKARIAGSSGHLSNDECADAVLKLARCGARQVVLAHLSEQNNLPELAVNSVLGRLNGEAHRVKIDVAFQHEPTKIFKIS